MVFCSAYVAVLLFPYTGLAYTPKGSVVAEGHVVSVQPPYVHSRSFSIAIQSYTTTLLTIRT